MKPVENWRHILRTAWSARFALLASLFGAVEIGVQIMAPQWGGWGALLAMLASLASAISRIVYQASLHQKDAQ